ncbi:MAG: hypothetical protein HYZ20_03130 [Burkholderiales bacterium]|nr:hypothetical protein [Burkholderiales bacterium]
MRDLTPTSAELVDTDAYLLQACRYVELNPLRAGLCADATQWRWSSCRSVLGLVAPQPWLDVSTLLGRLLGRPPASDEDFAAARRDYAEWLALGSGPTFHDMEHRTTPLDPAS